MDTRKHTVMLIAFSVAIFLATQNAAAQPQQREPRIGLVYLQGNTALSASDLRDIVECVNQLSSGEDRLRGISERLLRRYQDIGYYKARIGDPEVRLRVREVDSQSEFDLVDLAITVEEGRKYRLSDVQLRGGKAFSPAEYRNILALKIGDVFNRSAVSRGLERLREAYCNIGYTNFTPVPDTNFDEERGLISLVIDIDEGKQFRWGLLTVEGENTVPGAKERLLNMWKSHKGTTYDCGRTLETFLREIGGRPEISAYELFRLSMDQQAGLANVEITLADQTWK
jgi:outer membrane protein assembly factor BamA